MTVVELQGQQRGPDAPNIGERLVSDRQSSERQPEGLVLLIDSDPSSVKFMARALSQAAVEVLVADRIAGPDGAAAVLRVKSGIQCIGARSADRTGAG